MMSAPPPKLTPQQRYRNAVVCAKRCEAQNSWLQAHSNWGAAYYWARCIQPADEQACNDALTRCAQAFSNLNSSEKLLTACLDYKPNDENSHIRIRDYFRKAIKNALAGEKCELSGWYRNYFRNEHLPALKTFLFGLISAIPNSLEKQKTLWLALIPGSALREVFHAPSNYLTNTSLGRGAFKTVINTLSAVAVSSSDQTIDPQIVDLVNNLEIKTKTHFLAKLTKHAPLLASALKQLLAQKNPPVLASPVSASTVAAKIGWPIEIPLQDLNFGNNNNSNTAV